MGRAGKRERRESAKVNTSSFSWRRKFLPKERERRGADWKKASLEYQ